VSRSLTPDQDALVREARHVVASEAARAQRRYPQVLHADLVAEGNLALVEAAFSFVPERGTPFSAYARLFVRGAMFDFGKREIPHAQALAGANRAAAAYLNAPHAKVPEPTECTHAEEQELLDQFADGLALTMIADYSISASLGGEQARVAEDWWARFMPALEAVIATLEPRAARLARLRLLERRTLRETADELGINYRTAQRLELETFQRIMKRLRAQGFDPG